MTTPPKRALGTAEISGTTSTALAERPDDSKPDIMTTPPSWLEQFLENQGKEIELRSAELQNDREREAQNHVHALKSLEAQLQDRSGERSHRLALVTRALILAGIGAVIVSAVIIYAIHASKPEVAMEIIKAIVLLIAGGAGGYGVGARRRKKEE